ncbi:hypothetical protein [Butyrivibrio sp. MC2021]|uniref:hypothetical protein n=1 Tax=Butyrivibrio sp. MC2021 TaxID=1408306 RepID=UPI00047A944A|nr:hypothetical protein [Butyrivibrio sp. MC2021]
MNKLFKRAAVAALTAIVLFAGMPAKSVKAADAAPVRTVTELSGKPDNQKVVYKLKLENAKVTDGQIAVVYDPAVFELEKSTVNQVFKESDVNKDYTEGDLKGLSIAFVGDKAVTANKTVLTLTFNVAKGLVAQESVIRTKVVTLNNDAEVLLEDAVLEDSFVVGKGNIVDPELEYVNQSILGVRVHWTKDENADGFLVFRREGKTGEFVQIADVQGRDYRDADVENKVTYYYKVVAYQVQGEETVYSNESNVKFVTVKKILGIF